MPRKTGKVWDYFELINTDGKKTARCNFCRKHFGTNATKLKNHCLSACKQCPEDIKTILQDKPIEISPSSVGSSTSTQFQHVLSTIPVSTPSPLGRENSLQSLASSHESNEQPQNSITPNQKREIDLSFARAIYATGTPLNILESSLWQKAINALNPAYSVPTRYMISNSLLNAEYERVQKETSDIINQAEALTIVMDGWTDINGKGTVNFIITTPKPFFYKCVYPGTNRETATYLFTQLKTIIDEIGPSKFVALVTDNTNSMKATWRMIETEYMHVFAIGCASHTLSLLLKDIMKLENFKACCDLITKIIKYIKKRHVESAYFEKMQKEKYENNSKTLKLPSPTRWGGFVIMMESFLSNREALEATMICQDLSINREIKQHVLTEDIWIKVNAYHNILKPILVATTKLESDAAVISEVPQMLDYVKEIMSSALSTCEVVTEEEERYIIGAIGKRQHFVEKPIHFAANILDPRFRGLKLTPEKVAKGQEFINQYAGILQKNTAKIMANLAEYRAKSGFYSQTGIWTTVDHIEPRTWWRGLCNCQILSSVARKLLSIPPSSASTERNWSLFGNTLTRCRNRITTERLQKLITVRANIRLLSDNPNENVYFADEEEEYISDLEEEEIDEDIEEISFQEPEASLSNFNVSESENSEGIDPTQDPLN